MTQMINQQLEKPEKASDCFLGKVHYLENTSFVFIGPYQKNEDEACFCCFEQMLKTNNSDYCYSLNNEPLRTTYYEWLKDVVEEMTDLLINTVYIIDKRTNELTKKEIHKHPLCPVCKDDVIEGTFLQDVKIDTPLMEDGRTTPLKEIKSRLDSFQQTLIDYDTGIGKRIFRDVESDIVPMYGIESYLGNRSYHSYGRSKGLISSKYAGLLEMIERFSSMVPHFKPSVYLSYESLKKQAKNPVDPNGLILPNGQMINEQMEVYDPAKKYYWTKCFDLGTEQTVYIPEQFIYYDHQILRNENRFVYETSNGTALGGSLQEAIIYGIFEAVERDNFLVHWYTKKLPRKINLETIQDEDINGVILFLKSKNFEVHLFDITLETGIPTVWVMAVNTSDESNLKIYNAAGSHYYPEKAIFSGLVEVATSAVIYNKILQGKKDSFAHLIDNPKAVQVMDDHVNYYAIEENLPAFDFLLKNLDKMEEISPKEMEPEFDFSYQSLKEVVLEHHPHLYVADLSNTVTKKLNLYVAKVLIPTLQPMTFGIQNERLNWQRLFEFGCTKEEVFLNWKPHPFP
ncbi:YcaO-like family protein [Bacillus aquiflavi]|uniref:YcaO-like family protein n=1 Tax=Bacillus aquiflavi TaxID=2672567 RepID=UPI001CA9BD3D|nr:YcaO-like family protein [Bacillus aquiflavi]UAC48728.1 YcaO-like family protein [Bacillus aquiflavi]